jgi:serine/threonine protein phosphatase PrpC
MTLALRYAARSDVGLIREGNEDAGYAGPALLAIADGMGGHAAGEVASSIAVATIAQLDEEPAGADLLDALAGAIDEANLRLRQMVEGDDALEGMGTTLTALLFAGARVGIAHIGDSRAFLLRGGEFSQITHDHTFVQTLVDEGRISAAEAEHHPQRSLLMRALDGRSQPEPDLSVRDVRPGDRYLVCSDGLSGVLSEDTMRATLLRGRVEETVDELVELALRAGGPDNITCIVADVIDSTDTAEVLGPASSAPRVVGAAGDPRSRQGRGPLVDSAAGRAALLRPPPDDDDDDASADLPVDGRPRRRFVLPAVLLGTFVVLLAVGGYTGLQLVRNQYYVGVQDDNVAIFQGVSSTLVGRSLSSVYESSNVDVDGLPDFDRARVEQAIPARDLEDARAIVERLEAEVARCAAAASPTLPAPTLSPTPPPVNAAPTLPTTPTTPTPTPTPSLPADCLGAGGTGDGS